MKRVAEVNEMCKHERNSLACYKCEFFVKIPENPYGGVNYYCSKPNIK